jgi:hypothetical protein
VIISISSDAEDDLIDGYWFHERQHPGLGDYFFTPASTKSYLVFIDFFLSVFRSVSIMR